MKEWKIEVLREDLEVLECKEYILSSKAAKN